MSEKQFEEYGSNISVIFEGAVLTAEMIEEAAKIAVECSGRHPCQDGHLVHPRFFTHNESQMCNQCGTWCEARSG